MEEKHAETKSEEQTQPETPQVKRDPFALFGKIMAAVLLVGLLLGGGYYLGTNGNSKTNPMPTPTQNSQTQVSPTSATQTVTQTQSQMTITPSVAKKTITAGPASGTSFGAYAIEIPADWTDAHDTTEITDKLTLAKDGYTLSIYQAPMGGGGCLYPGDPPSEMAQNFTDYATITSSTSKLRRSWNKTGNPAGTITYTVCQAGSDNSFGTPTSYGAISVKAPEPADEKIMAEIDAMISSLVKK